MSVDYVQERVQFGRPIVELIGSAALKAHASRVARARFDLALKGPPRHRLHRQVSAAPQPEARPGSAAGAGGSTLMKVEVRPSSAEAEQYFSQGLRSEELIDTFLTEQTADPNRRARPAIVDGDITLTYAELNSRVDFLAAALAKLGAAPGEVVSWQLPNWWEAIALHLAIIRLGAVSNPIIAIYRRSEVQFILEQAQSKIFVFPERFRGFEPICRRSSTR
jgi:non-ribosomal peptide synthetase component F